MSVLQRCPLRESLLCTGRLRAKVQPHTLLQVYVVVQFYPWFKFYFLLFLGMVMYDNEFETLENKI